jgi:radical SAM protein with 4Fe4S-binding SPASM domain
MTTTAASLNYPEEIIDTYIEYGFDEVFLRYLSPYGHAIKTGSHAKYDNQRWMKFYFEGLDYIIELNKSGIDLTEAMASTYLKKMLTNEPTTFVDMSTPTGAGLGALVYNYDGDVYSSDEGRMLKEMGDQTFRLGSVAANSYQELMLTEVMLDATEQSFAPSAPMCSDCSLEPFCGSDATVHHTLQGDFVGFKPDSPFCERTMTIVPYLMKRYNEDEFCRDLFTRWANR